MKVIYVYEGPLNSDYLCGELIDDILLEGEQYNVIDSVILEDFCWYELAENIGWIYDSRRFERANEFNKCIEEVQTVVDKETSISTPF